MEHLNQKSTSGTSAWWRVPAGINATLDWTTLVFCALIDMAFRLVALASIPVLFFGLILLMTNSALDGMIFHQWPLILVAWTIAQIIAIDCNFLLFLVDLIQDKAPRGGTRLTRKLWQARQIARLAVASVLGVAVIAPLVQFGLDTASLTSATAPSWVIVIRNVGIVGILIVNALLNPTVRRRLENEREAFYGIPVTNTASTGDEQTPAE
jgi:hypothetical protein